MKKIIQSLGLFLLFWTTEGHAQDVVKDSNLSYGEADGQKLLLDVFRPPAKIDKKRPAVILVHGGGWAAGDKQEYHDLGMELARWGYVAFSINYRLATETSNHWPAQLDDAQKAVRWVRSHADQYGIDPNRIGALGGSAGGHLVTFLGTRDTRDNSDPTLAAWSSRVQCVVDLYGPSDLTDEEQPGKIKMGANTRDILRRFLGKNPIDIPEVAKDASPIFWVDAKSAPFLIFQGKIDDLVPPNQSERLQAALLKAGIESKLVVFEKEGHGFTLKEDIDNLVLAVRDFFNNHLHP